VAVKTCVTPSASTIEMPLLKFTAVSSPFLVEFKEHEVCRPSSSSIFAGLEDLPL